MHFLGTFPGRQCGGSLFSLILLLIIFCVSSKKTSEFGLIYKSLGRPEGATFNFFQVQTLSCCFEMVTAAA